MRILLLSLAFITLSLQNIYSDTPVVSSNQPVWREDFTSMPTAWSIRTKPRTAPAEFSVNTDCASDNGCLVMKADNASSTLLVELEHIDLNKTPILRWRWRVTRLPETADGRIPEKDDQAIGIYISHGSLMRRRSIAYRWETETPVGEQGVAKYAGGIVQVKWFCLRNKDDSLDSEFFIEERNVAEDFKKAFGYIPTEIGIGVSCNSQYTETQAEAQLDWIELRESVK